MTASRPPAPGPASTPTLQLARHVVYAAVSGSTPEQGHHAARAELAQLTVDQLLDVAATLAALLGRPGEVQLTWDEWVEVAERILRGGQ